MAKGLGMDRRKLARLVRVLGLLSSDKAGERASAAYAADRLVAAMGTNWAELLLPPASSRSRAYDLEERAAAEARMRQLKAINDRLESQVRSLRRRLAAKAAEERRRQEAEE
jgi:hypothetical protein